MSPERRLRLWDLVVAEARGAVVAVEHVCAVSVTVTGADSAAVAVSLRSTPREVLWASDPVASRVAELTVTFGEGPSVDATSGGPALVGDLTAPYCQARWPAFAPAAVAGGVRAVFALPLQIGGIRLGVLDLYRARAGDLDGEQLADALVLADTVCAVLLDGPAQSRPDQDGRWPAQPALRHPEVHQATGMVTVQMGVSVDVALVRLRAYAYAHDRSLRDVAGDVVGRRLRFEPELAAERDS
ncbi:GAF and ANTAR domain-containing protein [Micromonospora sp. DSM 115977]|uniref:GAF and ANTAR domain-containing protein n=1 Tax=Micromonospora reichwaldensis TaxID=3075516 RepID=A0ABU2WYF6_9ACTN|nr:GAF and ANTAR domain-containing protein [Micromonospora sp. DSM 115977]MDT0530967.1 GAF and ANTAR domain-containing protein [Micromonospora sp. DSM 115977]